MVPDWAASGPLLYGFLFVVIFFRAQGTYWLARFAAAGALTGENSSGIRGAVARWFNGPVPRRGSALLKKWGLIIIPLCFLTAGVQTAVIAGAGLVRLDWRTFTVAMLPGCAIWAALYSLGLLALWMAALGAIAGNPVAWIVIAVIAIVGLSTLWFRRSRQTAAAKK